MAKGYSNDLRARVVGMVEAGESRRETARLLEIGASTAIRWLERWTSTGSVAAKPGTGHNRSPLEAHKSGDSMSVTTSPSKKTLHAAEQDRPDVAAARAELKAEQPSLKARRLVFIDETSVTTKMVRHYGRCPRGERLVAKVPHGHWKTMTFIAGLRADGLTAPYVIDGAMDGPAFLAYVEQVLAPTLDKGDVVFMDNLRTHKVDGVAEALKAVGAKVRYLPAYSPDLNPIEMAFAKLKAALRKGAARTVKALWKLIGKLVKKFAPEECSNYFQHAGYG